MYRDSKPYINYINLYKKIDLQLSDIKLLMDFHCKSAKPDWADIGDLEYVNSQLQEIVKFLKK